MTENLKRWKEEHPDYNKNYYINNREREKKRSADYKKEHRQEILEYFRKRYAETKEQQNINCRNYYKLHKTEIKLRKAIKKKQSFCCEPISEIENYELAVKDNFVGWVTHHRKEFEDNGYSREELKDKGLYYNRPAKELIFLRAGEHRKLHLAFNRG